MIDGGAPGRARPRAPARPGTLTAPICRSAAQMKPFVADGTLKVPLATRPAAAVPGCAAASAGWRIDRAKPLRDGVREDDVTLPGAGRYFPGSLAPRPENRRAVIPWGGVAR